MVDSLIRLIMNSGFIKTDIEPKIGVIIMIMKKAGSNKNNKSEREDSMAELLKKSTKNINTVAKLIREEERLGIYEENIKKLKRPF